MESLLTGLICFCSYTHIQVSKPVLDHVLNCLRIEVSDITITLSARWASDSQRTLKWKSVFIYDFHKIPSHPSFKTTEYVKSQAFQKHQVWLFVCLSPQFGRREGGLVPHTKSSYSRPCCRTLYIWGTLQWGNNLNATTYENSKEFCGRGKVMIWFVQCIR